MDFCVNVREEGLYDAEIKSMGGKIYHIPSKSENLKSFSRQLYHIVKDNEYRNVMRITSNAMGFYDLHVAKKAGATNCIARSSNSSDGGSLKSRIAHIVGKLLYKRDVDIEIAPSDLAAIYTFGEKDYRSGKVVLLRNGINFEEYRYSSKAREQVRNELGVDLSAPLLGHVGRFTKQKNHLFLLEAFAIMHRELPNAKLLLVGEGELEQVVRKRCSELHLESAVVFAGVRKDIPALLSALDVFVFPSLYEGMPNTVIEAQASGLSCLISDTITKDVLLTPLVRQMALGRASDWANGMMHCFTENDLRNRARCSLPEAYNIREVAIQLSSLWV